MSFPALLLAVVLSAAAPVAPLTPADFAFALSGPAVEGKAALDDGRYEEAARKLARSDLPEAAYLRARALVGAARPAEAVKALEGLEAKLPDLADRVAFLRGEAFQGAGRPRDAIVAWSSVPDDSLLADEARLARGRAAAAAGDRERALDALAPLLMLGRPEDPGKPDRAATALLIAARLRASGPAADIASARRLLVACWAEHPLAPEAAQCRAAIAALPEAGRRDLAPEEILRRAEVLLEQNRNDSALALVGPLLDELAEPAPGETTACRAHAVAGRAYRKERRHDRAMEALRPVVERCDDPVVRVRALFVLAGSAAIAGDRLEGAALYRRLARDFPAHPYADDALFSAAELLAREERLDDARDVLATLVATYPGGDHTDEARFRLAWLAKTAGEPDAAVALLLAIEEAKRDRDPYEHARAAYWRARLLEGRGDEGRRVARVIWRDLATRYPADYYGLLSRARLSSPGAEEAALPAPIADSGAETRWEPGALREDRHFRSGVALLRAGLAREAADELQAVDPRRLRGADVETPEPVLVVADLLDRAGDHRTAHHLLRTQAKVTLRRAPEGENLRAWHIAYPPAFRDDVKRWAPPAGVPVNLLQALMREESALEPRAVSPAGAIGLTQLMLPTAREVARGLRIGRPSRTDLMGASLNIRLGARYLGQLIRQFDGSVALALAAYNAGSGAVSRWLDVRGNLELDEFVEEIPYDETRGYVKRVLRSYAAYRLLYGGPGETASLGLVRRPAG